MLNKQKIGIIGGMGPFAGSKLLEMLLKRASVLGAKNSCDFPEILLDSVPIKDFISDTKSVPSSKRTLSKKILNMIDQRCQTIAIACNTAHIIFPELDKISGGRMVSIIDAVRDKVLKTKATRVGLIATPVTIKSGLYQSVFDNTRVKLVIPNTSLTKFAEEVIRNEISGKPSELKRKEFIDQTLDFMNNEKLDLIILGCTELPLVFKDFNSNKFIDCLEALSEKLIN